MDYLPIFMDLRGRHCVVVGGGEVAARKVSLLAAACARITVVSPELCAPLAAEVAAGRLVHRAAGYSEGDLEGAVLAIAATDDRAVNARVSADAQRRCIPVNAVDDPELCSFIMPAIVDRSPVVIAISTGGSSPVLARLMRGRLESLIPAAYGRLAAMADRFRDRVKARFDSTEARRVFWEKVFEGPVAEMVFSGREAEAEAELGAAIDSADAGSIATGEVYLVGAGPGNPDLLTFAALRLMQQADVVVHDALVSQPVLDLVRRDAERIYVGKRRADHALPQEDINRLLSRLAKEGRRVLRLKGGDPFVFGRGGEEIEHLAAEGIRFQVIPGITAATGCAAFAGIPLTHRDYAHACVFVTGHLMDGTLDLDWEALARPQQTVVVYMGLHGLQSLCREMTAHGLPGSTPAAMIEKGTQPGQRIVTGTLDTLHRLVKEADLKPPTLVIVGEVVKLREKLRWGG